MGLERPTVSIVYKSLPHYRVAFFESLREALSSQDVVLRLIYGRPTAEEEAKRDRRDLEWARAIDNRIVRIGRRNLYWQPCFRELRGSELVIVEQASKLLINYVLVARQKMPGGAKVALWGHGRNFQERSASLLGERLKRGMSKAAHWWFAYNRLSAQIVRDLGFPEDRISIVNNTVDTSEMIRTKNSTDERTLADIRREIGIHGKNVALFSGSLYKEKRLNFLVEAAVEARRKLSDFEIVVVGAGPDSWIVERASSKFAWFHYLGALFGEKKTRASLAAEVTLMPGAVGLGIIDAFALEKPLITTAVPDHGPEIDYLVNGMNGIMLPKQVSPVDYATAIVDLMNDEKKLSALRRACAEAAASYSMEEMVKRFSDGVVSALGR
jgi:glycosyltransferase involved in cell wall biosynthesis